MMLVSLISYIDRNTLALLAPTILKETHLSNEQYGFIVSAFSVCYMIANPLWGRVLDRVGLRRGMTAAVLFWTLASAAHAWAAGFWSFAMARAALGFGEGATFPGGLRAVTQTLPPAQQARGLALAYSGGALGAVITPIIVSPIALWWGWRAAFLFTGLVGAAWLTMWFFVSRRRDVRAHPLEALSSPPAMRFRDPRVWGLILGYAMGALPLGFVMYGAALYLGQAMGASQKLIGAVLWIPPLGWELGYLVWGWLLDHMTRTGMPRYTAVRRLMFAAAWLSLPLALVPHAPSMGVALGLMFLAMFTTVGFVVPPVSYMVHLFSPAHSGLIAGLGAGSYGAAVAIFMPLFGRLFDQRRYNEAFALAAVLPVLGYICWRAINRPTPDGATCA
jgi:ACS family hexuronate transporter-like MFS transporter